MLQFQVIKGNLKSLLVTFVSVSSLIACGQAPNVISAGQDASRIIGGTDATGEETFTRTIALLVNLNQGSICTASILSEELLITAAHCVDGTPASSLRVAFGLELKDVAVDMIRPVDSFKISFLWPHNKNSMRNAGDIALVRFSGGIPEGYEPAALLDRSEEEVLVDGAEVVLAGYGLTNSETREGSGRLRYVSVTIGMSDFSETEILLDQRQGKGACRGDSGGPAYVMVDGQLKLWGITNRGSRDCLQYAIYAKIPAWSDWVQQTAATLLNPPEAIEALALAQ